VVTTLSAAESHREAVPVPPWQLVTHPSTTSTDAQLATLGTMGCHPALAVAPEGGTVRRPTPGSTTWGHAEERNPATVPPNDV